MPDQESVRGLKRLRVELDGGVLHTLFRVREQLEAVVVCGGNCATAGAMKKAEERLPQCRSLGRVSACADFIEQHKCADLV